MSHKCAVRLVNADFYMSPPVPDVDVMYADFRGSSIPLVPVVRIFGSTDTGQKICLHVHGVFPYLYVPYDGSEDASHLKYQIAVNIDKAINISFGQASSTAQHVYKITLVSGIPFYGYHGREHQFFKICLFNPALIRKVSNLLQSEVILGRLYQPHEAHIPYILQFMMDYNLHGMSRILLSDLTFRDSSGGVAKLSNCELEADTLCENILNRLEISGSNLGANPGIAALWEDEKQRLRDKGEDSEIGTCLTLENSQAEPTKTHLLFKQALAEKLCLYEEPSESSDLSQNSTDLSLSVYPAETPRNKILKNASFVDMPSPLSSESFNESVDLNATFDENAKDLFEILRDLGRKNRESDEPETDCILSQTEKVEEGEEEEEGNDGFDLGMSMAETTPFKNILKNLEDGHLEEDLDRTLVPQLDGQDDSDDENESRGRLTQKKSKYGALPIFVSSPAVNGRNSEIPNERKYDPVDEVKRKLNFQSSVSNVTISENAIECQYTTQNRERLWNTGGPAKRRKVKKSLTSKNDNETSSLGSKEKEDDMKQRNCNKPNESCSGEKLSSGEKIEEFSSGEKKQHEGETDQQNVYQESKDPEDNRDNIPEDEINPAMESKKQTPTEPTLTAAQLYDFQTNYKAKEGSSTVLTQTSQDCNLKLSAESSTDIFSSHEEAFPQPQSSVLADPTSDVDSQKCTKCTSNAHFPNKNPDLNFTRLEDTGRHQIITPHLRPPTRDEVLSSLEKLKIPKVAHETPFYSDVRDVTGSVEVGHRVLKIPSKTTMHLEDCKMRNEGMDAYRKTKMPGNVKWTYENLKKVKLSYCGSDTCTIEPVKQPPTSQEVEEWVKQNQNEEKKNERHEEKKVKRDKILIPNSPGADVSDMELTLTLSPSEDAAEGVGSTSPILGKNSKRRRKNNNSCRISGRTLDNTYGFKITPDNLQNAKAINEYDYLTIMSLEIHVETRGDLKPDPAYDSVQGIFYSLVEYGPDHRSSTGCLGIKMKLSEVNHELLSVETEEQLFTELVNLVQERDPDILCGYETELSSWGFLLERAQVLGIDLLSRLSRLKEKTRGYYSDEGLKVTGRMLIDVWRLLRHEVALQSYTFESIAYHLLHKRLPLYAFKSLTRWWNSKYRYRTADYYFVRVEGSLQILDQLDLVGRTSELARLFGIQFFEVLSRGSQFRVESMMLRLAKPLNYIPVSPSVQQRAKMKAPEYLPLILEPESKFYVDPVIVLDFQSLYPSMIIAYNYCFSTCLGKVIHLGKNAAFEFGATQLRVSRKAVQKFLARDLLNFSPCGVAFVKKTVRDGILPRMLREILETRLMVKKSMKQNKGDKVLQKVLHNRQLGLKLIANVTYGYSAANFSGRMPAVEIADSVVSKGRETLQRAIELVEGTREWSARVVYGDTDSLFVLVAGKSRSEAFEIGRQIADAVTSANPDPVKLKLEKVYQPCILQTKKRYVGYMYEGPDQSEPVYDAKGIETVRRDGCPAVAKMLEKCLRVLFETRDVSLVKKYVVRQFHKIVTGRVSLQDLTFAREYRGAAGYRPGACVPALELTRKWTSSDRRNEPRRGERVPYVIVSGPPGVPLIRLVRSPREFLNDSSLRPNAIYYITKVIIPPLNRCFNLIGADLTGWFNQMPRRHLQILRNASPVKKSTISQYFVTNSCAVCGEQTHKSLCETCVQRPQNSLVVLHEKIRMWEQAFCETCLMCQSCTGCAENDVCISLDCPILYKVSQTSRDVEQAAYAREVISLLSELSF